MDDFEYSLHISDQDWDTFFLECEGCNVLSPGLASREDSGMSDFDEMGSHFHGMTRLSASFTEPDPQIDGPPHCEGSPVDNYLSRYGIHSPEQVLSGSEEDLHLQTVNLFFEQLKSITVNEQPSEQSHTEYSGSEKTDHLECLIDKQDLQYVVICPSAMSEASPKGQISKQGEAHTWGRTALEKPIMPTCTNAQVNAPDSSKSEPDFGGEPLSFQLITVGAKQEQEKRCWDPKLKPETKPPDKEKMPPMVRVNGIDMTIPIPTRGAIAQMDIGCRSDSIDSPISPIPISPSNLRRKRRKKKRMFIEAEEMSPEAQIRIHQSESEEERFVQRDEPTNLSANVKKTEQASLSGMKISTVRYNSDHSHQSFSAGSEVPAGLKCSKSLPVSFTTFNGKPQVLQTSLCSISKRMNEMSLENNGLLKAESGTKSILVQIDKVLSKQESNIALNILESNSTIQLRGTDCSPTDTRKIKSETLSDHSQTGCQRKYLLSPNISSTADSTGPFSSSVSFNLTEETNKDVSCLGNETDYCAFISEQNLQSRWNTTVIFDALQSSPSLMEKIVESETCSHGGTPKMYSNEMQEEKAGTNVDNLETFKTSMDRPLSGAKSDTECHGTETVGSDEKVEEYVQNTNNKSEVLMVNALLMKPVGSTGESENNIKTEDDHLHHAAEDTTIGEHLLNEIKTRSSERIHGYDEDIKMHNKDSVENPSANVSQNTFSSPPDSKSESNDPLDTTRLDSPDQIPSPVFAISSFWNEMEKLTINDILGLRRIGNTQNPSVLTHPDDRSVDATDAADSGYFTQPDDSKTEHLSGDMSFISDLDEDIAQIQAQYSLKQDDESCGFPSRSCSVMWENDSDPATMGEDMMYISSETALPDQFFGADVQPCFRKILKNISVQNLQTLDAQPMREMLRKASLHSIHSEADDPFYHVNTSYLTCFSDDEDVDGDGIRFSEIIEYFFGHDEPEPCAFLADQNATTPFIEDSGTSVPEMYDHFFSEFDSGSFFNPFEIGGNQMVPIFSCTRFANRNLQFPEAYDYFFPDSPVHSDEDDDNEAPTRVVSRYDHTPSNPYSVATTDMYEHFYPEDTFQGNLLWANPFSFRRFQRTDSEEKSWSLTPVKPFHKGIQSTAVIGLEDKPFPDSLYLNLENQIFQQLAEQQKKCMELQTVIADPRLDAPFLPLRQADMCLVCIAFASWVLKSASPGADTWKAALLANISALSAIRYLRRDKRGEASGKTPLLQIEPA